MTSLSDTLGRLQVGRIEDFWSHQISALLHTMNYVG
ncbi:TPA: hypothetical protein N0F65_005553 [Lagenidium giganteum]|uniref:Uncharacterized protein n=1 Tax=Lagenidium giganteum TaxID=4803 RepID=A0AAV2YW91_9STRA|nr:TPA: hypothetical protein N0F65_005553 [Lagenidium giganteum]